MNLDALAGGLLIALFIAGIVMLIKKRFIAGIGLVIGAVYIPISISTFANWTDIFRVLISVLITGIALYIDRRYRKKTFLDTLRNCPFWLSGGIIALAGGWCLWMGIEIKCTVLVVAGSVQIANWPIVVIGDMIDNYRKKKPKNS